MLKKRVFCKILSMIYRILVVFLYLFFLFSCSEEQPVFEFQNKEILGCYDLNYSNLRVTFSLSDKEIQGSHAMYFKSECSIDTLIIDLFENLIVDSVLLDNKLVPFVKESNKLLVIGNIEKDVFFCIDVFYHGSPITAENPPWSGGFVWANDDDNLDWIGVACQQESGALWFPSKHNLADEPDSMRISLSVPVPYIAVSNGKLMSLRRDEYNNKNHVFEWLVVNPINSYNVTCNIANYAHFQDTLQGKNGSLNLDYYVLDNNVLLAKKHFKQVKPMLHVFENLFGEYPFYEDGYKLVETHYVGMEHQSCISYGNRYMKGYLGTFPYNIDFDFIIIHETAHEWWGNSVSMENRRDMWIHESFATYSEALYVEQVYGYDAMLVYLNHQKAKILNKEPIIYHDHSTTDMYYKGSWMLHTLRTMLQNDSVWMDILKGLQINFRHQIVNTTDVIEYIEEKCGYDLDSFFEQYLFHYEIPVFEYFFTTMNDSVILNFKWKSISPSFDMPLLVKINNASYSWIYPEQDWKEVILTDIIAEEFQVAEELFLIDINKID